MQSVAPTKHEFPAAHPVRRMLRLAALQHAGLINADQYKLRVSDYWRQVQAEIMQVVQGETMQPPNTQSRFLAVVLAIVAFVALCVAAAWLGHQDGIHGAIQRPPRHTIGR